MPVSSVPVESAASPTKSEEPGKDQSAVVRPASRWGSFVTPVLVVILALGVLVTVTWNWNSWEGGHVEQVTDDAYVRGDLTPLGTKVAGIVRNVAVSDYQQVHKGDLIAELEDNDYQAQVSQANAGVAAAKAAIEDNQRQEQLQGAKIDRALAAVEEAKAGILASQSHIDAVQAEISRTLPERRRQEALISTGSTTQQKVEQAVAADEGARAQLAS